MSVLKPVILRYEIAAICAHPLRIRRSLIRLSLRCSPSSTPSGSNRLAPVRYCYNVGVPDAQGIDLVQSKSLRSGRSMRILLVEVMLIAARRWTVHPFVTDRRTAPDSGCHPMGQPIFIIYTEHRNYRSIAFQVLP